MAARTTTSTRRHGRQLRILTTDDVRRLKTLMDTRLRGRAGEQPSYDAWNEVLDSALVTAPRLVGPQVVTIHSRVQVLDIETRTIATWTLVFPGEARADDGMLSVLSPIGRALVGRSAGDLVTCVTPGGGRPLKIVAVLYQPEAAGDYER